MSEGARSIMTAVASEFSLNPGQVQKYNAIFDAVLYGLVPRTQVDGVLMQELGVDMPKAQQIVGRANATFLAHLSSVTPFSSNAVEVVPSVPDNARPQLTATTIHTAIDAYGLVRERLERLPQGVQTTIRSQELENSLNALMKKHQIGPEKAPVFVAEAVRVMVGLTTTNNFKMEVASALAFNPNKLDLLFLDSESTLFKPVRMAIMQALEQKREPVQAPTAPTATALPTRSTDPYREPIQ